MKQESFSDMEYAYRKKKTKREEFLEIMDEIIPWEEWVSLIVPHYPSGKRGRPPVEIETILQMYLLQCCSACTTIALLPLLLTVYWNSSRFIQCFLRVRLGWFCTSLLCPGFSVRGKRDFFPPRLW